MFHDLVTNVKGESMNAHMYRQHVKLYGMICVYMFTREYYKMQIDQTDCVGNVEITDISESDKAFVVCLRVKSFSHRLLLLFKL